MPMKFTLLAMAAMVAAAPAFAQNDAEKLSAKWKADIDKPVSAEGQALGDCMVAHSTPAVEQMFKTVLVDALTDETEKLNKDGAMMGISIVAIAIQSCGLTATDMQSPKLAEGARLYGEAVSLKIMGAAFAKLGQ